MDYERRCAKLAADVAARGNEIGLDEFIERARSIAADAGVSFDEAAGHVLDILRDTYGIC